MHVLFPWVPVYPVTQMFPQNTLIQVLVYILTSASSTRSPVENLPPTSLFLISPPATSLYILKYQSVQHSNSSGSSSISNATRTTRVQSIFLMTVTSLPNQMISCTLLDNSTKFVFESIFIRLDILPTNFQLDVTSPS